MRVPDESLEDFIIKVSAPKTVEPPAVVSLHLSGKVKVIKPVVDTRLDSKRNAAAGRAFHRRTSYVPPSFHRSLALGGAFAVIAVIIATGIHLVIFGPSVQQVGPRELSLDSHSDDILPPVNEPFAWELLPDVGSSTSLGAPAGPRQAKRRGHSRYRGQSSDHRMRRIARRPHVVFSGFVPTTIIIYAENGEIRSRVEPQPVDGNRKS
jgi:hypothetical protein